MNKRTKVGWIPGVHVGLEISLWEGDVGDS